MSVLEILKEKHSNIEVKSTYRQKALYANLFFDVIMKIQNSEIHGRSGMKMSNIGKVSIDMGFLDQDLENQ